MCSLHKTCAYLGLQNLFTFFRHFWHPYLQQVTDNTLCFIQCRRRNIADEAACCQTRQSVRERGVSTTHRWARAKRSYRSYSCCGDQRRTFVISALDRLYLAQRSWRNVGFQKPILEVQQSSAQLPLQVNPVLRLGRISAFGLHICVTPGGKVRTALKKLESC